MKATTIPILPSSDFDRTATFYARLGFVERGRWPGEYLILCRADGPIELHFWSNPQVDPLRNDVGCYIRLDGPDEARALHEQWTGNADFSAGGRLVAPKQTDYGLVELALIDPHGNLLRIGG